MGPEPGLGRSGGGKSRITMLCTPRGQLETAIRDWGPFNCEVCGAAFSRRSALITHGLANKVSCSECTQVFCNTKKLNEHIKIHHQTKFECDYCENVFQKNWMLARHKRGAFQAPCEICYQKFCSSTILKSHMMRSHKSVDCNICGKFVLLKEMIVLKCVECSQSSS